MNQTDGINNWIHKWGRETAFLYRRILINNYKRKLYKSRKSP